MAEQTKGTCKYCGKEYTIGYMKRHLASCQRRQTKLSAEKGKQKCGYFELEIRAKYDKDYWLLIEIEETATLQTLDYFLRDIWLECCGHMSAFKIDGVIYEEQLEDDFGWKISAESLTCELSSVLKKGMKIEYEYDFGSTTELTITVLEYRIGYKKSKREKLMILSRNNPPIYLCSCCGEKAATQICIERVWEGTGFLCEDCAKAEEDEKEDYEDDWWLPVCNSPRMGVCAYEGSSCYPDQFVPDKGDLE